MRRALDLAARGWARTRPNPMVGAVVVQGADIVGEGWHAEYGGPHAEVVALEAAGERARGATLYVTLEPCNHHGRTPPCTHAVLDAGVARVVIPTTDPNPRAVGGVSRLRAAGIEVTTGVEATAARSLNAEFFHHHEVGTVFTVLKLAMSLDGRLSEQAGTPSSVTNATVSDTVHRLRAGFDAIMVGAGTARADDPLLTVRGELQPRKPPVRVVIDSNASLQPESRLVRTADVAPVQVFCTDRAADDRVAALTGAGVQVRRVPARGRLVDLEHVLSTLRDDGMSAVLCEGGGALAAALLARDLVQRMHLFIAPRFFGAAGTPAFPLERPGVACWRLVQQHVHDGDVELVYDRAGS